LPSPQFSAVLPAVEDKSLSLPILFTTDFITASAAAERQILPNRFYYNYQLHQYLVSQQDSIKQLAIIRLNIDRFRPLNEFLSNNGGDELLRQVAQRLRLTNAEALIVAHLNGDDFAIVYEVSHIRPSVQEHIDRPNKPADLHWDIFL
jgi:diguanylate cyclase (GGDEF)-like protein